MMPDYDVKLIDTHCHLDFEELRSRLPQIISDARDNCVCAMVTISTNLNKIDKIKEISENYKNVFFSVGVHPNEAHRDQKYIDFEYMKKTSLEKKCVAIGEGGLDYFYNKDNMVFQKKSFICQINVARETNLPIIIHSRDADKDMIDILKSEYKNGPFKAILHCFSSGKELAYCGMDLNFYISFSGILTFNSAKEIQKIAKEVPLHQLLVETDSPYLSPVPFRGTVNEPKNCFFTAKFLSRLKNIYLIDLAPILYKNSKKIFDKLKV